ncbi:NADP-dependent oxidoreductase [Dactylosporangium matsuzakiense]|uniref:NADPH:quinone reductase n=1 Tax=Dactylosporangium matsuzakiense TaxID=53360 RepID=A0A9W6KR12_9ACTN|nr:NADP-dependent oxidoreductase [Dactylosporangium matsuzakiense]UWZ41294.1 NADP-dependent oxidoreductase [Dactylosporangium matsuzakiense]GLL05673.1 NADPH:quinone reductase [Dactylosporangium matsuzakiense]
MRAVVQHRFGAPGVLELTEVDPPRPLPTEVLVEVHAVGLNPVEAVVRAGHFPLLGPPPFILGWDISGVVVEVVPGVHRFRVGDEVYGMPFFPRAGNAYAEYVAAPSRQLARKPRSIDHVHAAGVPLAGLTAWQGLVDVAGVREGHRVLIHGAGGGVGHLAVGIAKALGAHVIATAGPGKHDFVRGLGADEVIDHYAVDFTTAAGDVDVVIDPIGGDVGDRSLDVLRPGGLLLSLVGRGDRRMTDLAAARGLRFEGISVEPDHHGLERLAALIDRGAVRPHVSRAFPLAEAHRAHELLDGTTQGKIVLTTR